MLKSNVVIAQANNERNDELEKLINETGEFVVVGKADNGLAAVKIIENYRPEFVLTELILPELDGFCVLEKALSVNRAAKVIVISAFATEETITKVMLKGAAYFMVKPFDNTVLINRMLDLSVSASSAAVSAAKDRGGVNLEEKISKIFINVGIPPHIKGYSYLREGVKMAVDNPRIINNITKQLYPQIGEKYDTSASKVERAIRHAIEVAWNRGRIDSINGILGVRAYVGSEKPTNGEFIALVADKMLLERG